MYQAFTASGDIMESSVVLTPVVMKANRQLSERLFNGKPNAKMDYTLIPTVVFSHPPIGTIGLTEQEVKAQYREKNIKVYDSNFTAMYTAVTQHHQPCRMKLICTGKEKNRCWLAQYRFCRRRNAPRLRGYYKNGCNNS